MRCGRSGTILVSAAILAACSSDRLAAGADGLQLDASALVFPNTWVGHPTTRTLLLHNGALARRTATLAASTPFATTGTSIDLAGGSPLSLEISFRPENAGDFASPLTITIDDHVWSVALTGTALMPPACPATDCHESSFEAASGACVTTTSPNGTSCSASCLDEARCQDGTCIGTPATCDDGNACTPAVCPAPSDPCELSLCDPATGCATSAAPDGTSCGVTDCLVARVCHAGRCVETPSTEGLSCESDSPCRDPGRCHAGSCVQPSPHVLAPKWTYTPAAGTRVFFPGLTDDAGNLYWTEQHDGLEELVSSTPDGLVRFRSPLAGQANQFGRDAPGTLAIFDGLVVSALSFDLLEAFQTSDGARAWTYDPRPDLPVIEGDLIQVGPLVPESSALLVRLQHTSTPGGCLATLDRATGVRIAELLCGRPDALPALGADDASAYIHLGANDVFHLIARGATAPRWDLTSTFFPTARVGNVLLGDDLGQLRALSTDGTDLWTLPASTPTPYWRPPVMNARIGWFLGQSCDPSAACDFTSTALSLLAFDPASGNLLSTRTVATAPRFATSPLLSSADGALFVLGEASGLSTLRHAQGDGSDAFSCALTDTDRLQKWAILSHETFIVASASGDLRAYPMPRVALAAHGWAAPFGSLARDQRPR
jgi:hypothetical protein